METRDLLEKTIEDMSKALKLLLKTDVYVESEAFIHEFEKSVCHDAGLNNKLLQYLNDTDGNAVTDRLVTTDTILVLYRAALAYQRQGNKLKSKHYVDLATSLESKPRTILYNDRDILVEIDKLKNALCCIAHQSRQ